MQADLKTLNLKKTFSFLQNLDYNDEEANPVGQGGIKSPMHRNILFNLEDEMIIQRKEDVSEFLDEYEERKTQRMMDPQKMELSISSLNNIQIFADNETNGGALGKNQRMLKKMPRAQENSEAQKNHSDKDKKSISCCAITKDKREMEDSKRPRNE